MLIATTLAAGLLYCNDFATRTSAEGTGPGLAWSVFRYAKGQPAAYNWNGFGPNLLTRPYDWQPTQDGWVKLFCVGGNINYIGSHVTDEADPCLVFSGADATINGIQSAASTHQAFIAHGFRNVFRSGVVKFQADLRQPLTRGTSQICWIRPLYEKGLQLDAKDSTYSVVDVGLSGNDLSGGWRTSPESPEGERVFFNYGTGLATAGHWYRHFVTIDLDSNKTSFEVYDLGSSRLPMDQTPSGSPMVSRTGLTPRYNVGGEAGGLCGFAVNVQALDTKGFYGDATFEADRAYMMDNVKGSYKAAGAASYVEFYRNDFATSRRRVVDGSVGSSFTYELDAPKTVTTTYALREAMVRDLSVRTIQAKPYLSGVFGSDGAVQTPGADGWRFVGNKNYVSPVVVTTNGANKVFTITDFGMNLQPMCPEVTSGDCRFEVDMRMPKGFNGTPRCVIDLLSAKAYASATANGTQIGSFGVCASDGKNGSSSALNKNLGFYGTGIHFGGDKQLYANKWYRIRAVLHLDTKTFDLAAYEIGDNAPVDPDDFVPSSDNLKLSRSGKGLWKPAGYDSGIGAIGVSNWVVAKDSAEGSDAAKLQMFFDNLRFWKANGNDWDLLYCNTADKTVRTYTVARKALTSETKAYVDRPEYGVDGFACAPTYYAPSYLVGSNHALQISGESYTSLSVPLGMNLKRGRLEAQYDVRLPRDVGDFNDTFQFYLGGAQLASASILPSTNAQRFNTGWAIGTGVYNDNQEAANGVKSVLRGICYDYAGKWYFTMNTGTGLDAKWIRVKIKADLDRKTYGVAYYDMGTQHPNVNTPDGTCIKDWSNTVIHFRWTTDPISHILFIGGRTPSYAPWMEDAPGALLLDNLKVTHTPNGLMLFVR